MRLLICSHHRIALCLFVAICIIAAKHQLSDRVVKSSLPLSYTEFLQMAVNFEECRKKWLQADEELVSCKEVLAKAETERGALEVKLKHARNQVDVEIRRRQKAEAVHEKLVGTAVLINLVYVHACLFGIHGKLEWKL